MKLAWHIALKDLRRLRVLIVLWTLLIAAKLGVGVMLIYGVGGNFLGQFDVLRLTSNTLAGLEAVAGFLIIAALVHGDVLIGSTSFWMTRPVSSGRLIGGKITGLACVFGAIPLAILFPWWLVCGYGVKEILIACVETVLVNGFVICAALPLATLTDGPGRYLFGTLILVTVTIFVNVMVPFIPGGGVGVIVVVVGASGVLAALVHLWNRRVFLGIVLFSACLAVAGMATLVVFAARYRGVPSQSIPGTSAERVTLSLLESGAQERVSSAGLALGFRATGVPADLVLEGAATHRWTWSDGGTVERRGTLSTDFNPMIWGRAYAQEDALRKRPFRIGLGLAFGPDERSSGITSVINLPLEFIDRVRRDAPAYLLSAEIHLMRPVVMGVRPARSGERIVSGRETTRIMAIASGRESRSAPFVRLQELRPMVFGLQEGLTGFGPFVLGLWPKRAYFLVDGKAGSLSSDYNGEYDTRRTPIVRIGTVGIVWRQLPGVPVGSDSNADVSPLENMSIAKFEFLEVERFTKEVRVDRFQLGFSQRIGRADR